MSSHHQVCKPVMSPPYLSRSPPSAPASQQAPPLHPLAFALSSFSSSLLDQRCQSTQRTASSENFHTAMAVVFICCGTKGTAACAFQIWHSIHLQDENGGTYTLKMTGVTHSSTELYKTQQKKDKQKTTFCLLLSVIRLTSISKNEMPVNAIQCMDC